MSSATEADEFSNISNMQVYFVRVFLCETRCVLYENMLLLNCCEMLCSLNESVMTCYCFSPSQSSNEMLPVCRVLVFSGHCVQENVLEPVLYVFSGQSVHVAIPSADDKY